MDWHLWCERHQIVVVYPCGLWEREAGVDKAHDSGRADDARPVLGDP